MNIIDILKYKLPQTPLYDVVIGAPVYLRDCSNDKIFCYYSNKIIEYNNEGKLYDNHNAIQALTPSKKMKDWSKFAWKEGDVLVNTTDKPFPKIIVFKKFVGEDYSTFESTCGLTVETKLAKYSIQSTLSYCKMKNEDDIRIAKEKIDELIREEEAANSPDHMLQPFDKVLVRDIKTEVWRPSFWGYKNDSTLFSYATTSGMFRYCIPYNEETKHLLGTTEPYKED